MCIRNLILRFFPLPLAVALILGSTAQAESVTKLAFASCIYHPEQAAFQQIEKSGPTAVIFLGDNIYLRHEELEDGPERVRRHARELYSKMQSDPDFQSLRAAIPTYAIWDDHDFGPNDSDAAFSFKTVTRQVFEDFWKLPPPEVKDGIYRSVEVGDALLLLTDNRSYRRPGESLFGSKQLDWMEKEIANTQRPVIVIASGGQLFTKGPWHEDYFEYPDERKRFMAMMRAVKKPLIVLSGDRHYADLLVPEIGGKKVLEATSSPLAASIANDYTIYPDPARKALFMERNFGLVTIRVGDSVSVQAEIRKPSGEQAVSYRTELE